MLTLLKHFTFAAATGQTMITDWVRIPEGNQIWQLVVLVHSRISTTNATLQLYTTWDTSVVDDIGSAVNLATVGLNVQDISSGVGPMVRLLLTAGGASDSATTISVWLTPKTT